MTKFTAASVIALATAPTIALASAPVPAPLAGTLGPVGLVIAGAAYLGYRAWRKHRD